MDNEHRIGIEYLRVFRRECEGKTVCMCLQSAKKCQRRCVKDVVERDKYRGWQDTFKVDRFGKSKY